jgi:hypothetical protein
MTRHHSTTPLGLILSLVIAGIASASCGEPQQPPQDVTPSPQQPVGDGAAPPTSKEPSPEPQPPTAATPASPEPVGGWRYDQTDTVMDGKVSLGIVDSTNQIELDFPYQGLQRGLLMLGTVGADKPPRVVFGVEKGQLTCMMECKLRVKFGDADPVEWGAGISDAGHTNVVVVDDPERFIRKVAAVDKVYVEATFYQRGPLTLEFDVRSPDWTKMGVAVQGAL